MGAACRGARIFRGRIAAGSLRPRPRAAAWHAEGCGAPRRTVPERQIPPDVLGLLQERLAGLDELEVLLLVRGDASREGWTASDVADRLGLPVSSSDAALESLCQAALLAIDGGGGGAERRYSYRPSTLELDRVVSSLAEIYDERRLEVMRILSNNALGRIRSAAARTFADAFVIGRNGSQNGSQNGRKKDG